MATPVAVSATAKATRRILTGYAEASALRHKRKPRSGESASGAGLLAAVASHGFPSAGCIASLITATVRQPRGSPVSPPEQPPRASEPRPIASVAAAIL